MWAKFFSRKYFFWSMLLLIIAWATWTRFYRLDKPANYIFDEVYHVITAKLMAHNDPRAFEWWNEPVEPNTAVDWLHPPLAKYTQSAAMLVFGENTFGWRFSSAITGILVIVVTALLARRVFDSDWLGLVAAYLAGMDGLLLVQSRIAMNDIHVTLMILATLLWYWQYRQNQRWQKLLLTGIGAGLAMGSKWSGLFVLLYVCLWELLSIGHWGKSAREWFYRIVFLAIVPVLIYVGSYWQMFAQGKTLVCQGTEIVSGRCFCSQTKSLWVEPVAFLLPGSVDDWAKLEQRGGCQRLISHFSELHHQIWWYQTNLTATHNYQSRPLQWFLDLKPVWFHVDYVDNDHRVNIYSQGNPWLFWTGAAASISLLVCVLAQLLKKYRSFSDTDLHRLLFIGGAYLIVWLPWQFSPRIMFFYHYTPAVPLLSILVAYVLHRGWLKAHQQPRHHWLKWLITLYLWLTGLVFVLFFPNWVGIPVPTWWMEKVYFALPSWK